MKTNSLRVSSARVTTLDTLYHINTRLQLILYSDGPAYPKRHSTYMFARSSC